MYLGRNISPKSAAAVIIDRKMANVEALIPFPRSAIEAELASRAGTPSNVGGAHIVGGRIVVTQISKRTNGGTENFFGPPTQVLPRLSTASTRNRRPSWRQVLARHVRVVGA
ncbi:hypothetical protein CTKA_02252 [Chthonomonas calidirosea]|uniref:Uncharacterized protein n=1 Tax=Chthonomonas calidirosea (strain DSM 23976 / ICMP 18418 / T49) TaxID=1303518 RepID=S0EV69_CHTCT|nr:hypothetical protein CCALI_01842 [Chthonomonas calidirosea T49]CEK19628.1 hypothetical protein CTKA_02252 [Chthonomonas calidirosea]